ncbi:AAA family ATPase [Desulfatirhabdium butyrativorans]|uniref:bifunctional aminoglycoside phosphotransferase/ATP-binding protein n=1 Tax=Desulfatirhabdium butyrativorans TaxID=340467 RepID=UPI00041EC9B5|nr:bifunctional aminoglycoside phosphotransferase/ATP-binding protein [Desulfatirhabdium butyrativorans]
MKLAPRKRGIESSKIEQEAALNTGNPPLIQALLDPGRYPHPVDSVQLIETHISFVLLAGRFAYKMKKPIDLGFLDFSSLEKRKQACEAEVRLNRRLAPEIYLGVLPLHGTAESPRWSPPGDPIEYVVQMVRFDETRQMDRMLSEGLLCSQHIDALAETVASFHEMLAERAVNSIYGAPDTIWRAVEGNFSQIRQWRPPEACRNALSDIASWSTETYRGQIGRFLERSRTGKVRECHGDLHLKNLAWIAGKPLVFDCIEFDPYLRWIDVINDCAFLTMDLGFQNAFAFAQRFLDGYLERTGDFDGLALLRFYMVYRVMVRAKVRLIRARQETRSGDAEASMHEFCRYIAYASTLIQPAPRGIILTFGPSASGKSRIARSLIERLPAFRIRSDVERKRIFGIASRSGAAAGFGEGIYSQDATRLTYDRLISLSETILDAGYIVIVDAAFLKASERDRFRKVAEKRHVPFCIVVLQASAATLRRRIRERKKGVSDAGPDILEKQLQTMEPLTGVETRFAIAFDTENDEDPAGLANRLKDRIGGRPAGPTHSANGT